MIGEQQAWSDWWKPMMYLSDEDFDIVHPSTKKVRTRFAPSPTGNLHLGSVRTAYFNWAWCQDIKDEFILRIDDTDSKRNVQEATDRIFEGLNWLGITPTHGPFFQSQRSHIYREAAIQLVRHGLAYPCNRTAEENAQDEIKAIRSGQPVVIRGQLRNQSAIVKLTMLSEDLPLRLAVPFDEKLRIVDYLKGEMIWDSNTISDPIIMRGDGTPLYNFATAVDDAMMEITHVIRGDEHLNNTPIQIWIIKALNKNVPHYAHLPVVCAPKSNRKLSKRDSGILMEPGSIDQFKEMGYNEEQIANELNPVCLDYYRRMGYPPDAVCNYLSRLGWSAGNQEIFSKEFFRKEFSLNGINKSSAQFDPVKMKWVSGEYIKKEKAEERAMKCLPFLKRLGLFGELDFDSLDYLIRVVSICADRIKVYSDIVTFAFFFRPPVYRQEHVQQRIRFVGTLGVLTDYANSLGKVAPTDWKNHLLQKHLQNFCLERTREKSPVIHATRVAITGHMFGPGLFEIMELLGQETTIQRINDCVRKAEAREI